MRSGARAARAAALTMALAVLGGCGWFGGRDTPPSEPAPSSFAGPQGLRGAFPSLTRAGAIYDIYRVVPDEGPLAGGNPAEVFGDFPPMQTIYSTYSAYSTYQIFFGSNPASLDVNFTPAFTSTKIYVVVPPGDAPGVVDVSLRYTDELNNSNEAAVLYDGYEYLDPFDITAIVPDIGPLAGGQQATVFGRFPIANPISTAAAAYDAYRVYIDGRPAPFDLAFDPLITSESIYILTPPGTVPGLVNVSVADAYSNEFRVLVDGYEYIGELELTDVVPDVGWIFGNEPVTLDGIFPVTTEFSDMLQAADAADYYHVFFGANLAAFDVIDPVITPTEMKVLTPPADDIGFVDVAVFDADNPGIFSRLEGAFRYYAMYITDIVPDEGPLEGGNPVEIFGLIPAYRNIDNIYEAEQYYSVFFGTEQAMFSDLDPPVISPSSIDIAAGMYTIGRMYVEVPPGLALGFVDVTIVDDLGIDLPAVAPDGYEYIADDDIGNWIDADVEPNPVPQLPAGELLVRIEVSGSLGENDQVVIVPHGGDPNVPEDRIVLEQAGSETNGENFVWLGTNSDEIPRRLDNDLLVDGHATLFLISGADDTGGGDGGEIIGLAEGGDPSEGGRIAANAQAGRHFIIDTIPPRMFVPFGGLRAEDFFAGNQTNAFDRRPSDIPPTNLHPYPTGVAGYEIAFVDVPTDGGTLNRPQLPDDRAQAFFNSVSVANRFYELSPGHLIFPDSAGNAPLTVVFEDPDIYTLLGIVDPDADPRNAHFFTGSTVRPVAGFNPTDDIQAPLPLTVDDIPMSLTEREGLLTEGPDVQIQWDFQPAFSGTPEMVDIEVDYVPSQPQAFDSTLQQSLDDLTEVDGSPPGVAASATVLTGVFRFGDPFAPNSSTGLLADSVDLRALMSVVFRAVDRAGDYVVPDIPGASNVGERKKLFTRNDPDFLDIEQPMLGPLNLWWIRDVSTRLIPLTIAGETSINPEFRWELAGTPPADAVIEPGAEDSAPQPLFNFAIWKTSMLEGLSREEQRRGPYTNAAEWSGFFPRTRLTTADINDALAPTGLEPGFWYLLVVVGADEAGNLEQWPTEQLGIDVLGTGTSAPQEVTVLEDSPTRDKNWAIWWVPPGEQVVDTRIQPTLWHENLPANGQIDPNETSFGSAQVVPLPANTDNRLVFGEFRVNLIVPTIADLDTARVDWRVTRSDNVTVVVTSPTQMAFPAGGGSSVTIVLPTNLPGFETGGLGDEASRQPVTYIFSATTVVQGPDGDIVDASPASFQFTVVDNVAEFLRNRTGRQPVLQFERQN